MEYKKMTAIFDAAKSGNTTELKLLKDDGELNLQTTDFHGNTALHWAACNGHLETVQWLLSLEDMFKITDSNNNGETPLSLAVAYGHLHLMQWLLSEDESKIVESLCKAVSNGQLLIVDYLIRTYYSDLHFGLPHQLKELIKHRSIYYYLEVFNIFSQERVDDSQLVLALDRAEKLSSDENSFIYLICYWMLVSSPLPTSTRSEFVIGADHFINKLSELHQIELFQFMFKTGNILINWLPQPNLNVTWIKLDPALNSQQALSPQAYDVHYSSASEIAKKKLELDFYLKPFYYSIVLAAQKDESVDEALDDPIMYLIDAIDESVSDSEIAECIAYHLCQRPNIPLESHKNVYTRMQEAARSTYYTKIGEIMCDVKLINDYFFHLHSNQDDLSNNKSIYLEFNPNKGLEYKILEHEGIISSNQLGIEFTQPFSLAQIEPVKSGILTLISYQGHIALEKHDLLRQLGNLADSNGDRLYWTNEFPKWLSSVADELKSPNQSQDTLTLIGVEGTISLNDEIINQIWNKEKNEPQPKTLSGNHPVYKLKLESGRTIFCKLYPGLPGINDALHYFYRRLFDVEGGLPWSTAGLLRTGKQAIPVLLSEDGGSEVKMNDARLQKLNHKTLSKLILFALLTNPEDGKLENHTLRLNAFGFYDAFSVDNDQGLVDATADTYKYAIYKTKKLSVKSLLFCLDEMNAPLDQEVVQEFLSLNPIDTLTAWLTDLTLLEDKYNFLFEEERERSATKKDILERSYLQMVLAVKTVVRITHKFQFLKEILNNNSAETPLNLLQQVEPVVANYYLAVLLESLSPQERFDKLVKNEALYSYNKKNQRYNITNTTCSEIFESFVPDSMAEVITPKVALVAFKAIAQQWHLLKTEQMLIMQGEIARLGLLNSKDVQNLLKLLRLNQFNSQQRSTLIQNISNRTNFNELYLFYPEANLTVDFFTFSSFEWLLYNNAGLESLTIIHATAIKEIPSLNRLLSLKKLKLSQLPEVTEVSASLPMLKELVIENNPKLIILDIEVPELCRVRITDCPNLKILKFKKSRLLDDIVIQRCSNLPLADFYNNWPRFISDWNEFPLNIREKLAQKITHSIAWDLDNSILKDKSYIYDTVNYYTSNLKFSYEVLKKSNDIDSWAFAFVTNGILPSYSGRPFSSHVIESKDSFGLLALSLKVLAGNRCYRSYVELVFNDFAISKVYRVNFRILKFGQFTDSLLKLTRVLDMNESNSVAVNELTPEDRHAISNLYELFNKEPTICGVSDFLVSHVLDENISFDLSENGYKLDSLIRNLLSSLFPVPPKSSWLKVSALRGLAVNILAGSRDPIQFSILCREQLRRFSMNDHYGKYVQMFAQNHGTVTSVRELTSADHIAVSELNIIIQTNPSVALISNYLIKHAQEISIPNLEARFTPLITSMNEIDVPTLLPIIASITPEEHSEIKLQHNSYSNLENVPIHSYDYSHLSSAVERGDLTAVTTLLKHKKFSLTEKRLNNALLMRAAHIGHFPIVTYLINHHYGNSTFSEQGMHSSNSLLEDKTSYYLKLYHLCNQKPFNKHSCLSLLKNIAQRFTPDNYSVFYLLYFGMQIHHQSQITNSKDKEDESMMGQLLPEHHMKLILLMIQTGYVLNSWSIRQNELILCDMTLDQKQIMALVKLLEGGEYELRQMTPQTIVQPNKIYLALNDDGVLECTALDTAGQKQIRKITEHELTTPFTLDQAMSGTLLRYIVDSLNIDSLLRSFSLQGIRFAGDGYESFLVLLKNRLLLSFVYDLAMRDCDLGDGDLEMLSPILASRANLLNVSLDNNHITAIGFEHLFDALDSSTDSFKWDTLSLCFNKLQIDVILELICWNKISVWVTKCYLEGNMIADGIQPQTLETIHHSKNRHRARVNLLIQFFPLLVKKDSSLTVKSFLTAINVSLEPFHHGRSLFHLTLSNSSVITIELDRQLYESYNLLPFEELRELSGDILQTTEQKIFTYLKANIMARCLPDELLDSSLPKESDKNVIKKQLCKKLLSYHPHARLKSHLITHSLFRSQQIEEAPSLLFPTRRITLEQGNVYLFSRKDTTHLMIGYEYLTGYGQRVLRVVHLQNEEKDIGGVKKSIMVVNEYNRADLLRLVTALHRNFDIAWFSAKTKGIKFIRDAIQKEFIKSKVDGRYKKLIIASSYNPDIEDEQNIKNCVTYCIDKVNNNSHSLGLKLNIPGHWFLIPKNIVSAINNEPDSIIERIELSPQMKQ